MNDALKIPYYLVASVRGGIKSPEKDKEWEKIIHIVNVVPNVALTITEIKKKWFDMN